MKNVVVWVDLPVKDLARAVKFYNAVLACECHVAGTLQDGFAVAPHGEVGICLTLEGGEPGPQGPLCYLNCEGRLDEAIAQVERAGGQILEARKSIAPHGFCAVILDSEGNRMALHAMA